MAKREATAVCGVIMPISEIDGCSEGHWADVLAIVTEAIESAGFTANIVSNADDVGVIQKRIIQNIYENEIIVCDVSGKNPNVMFELGLRLAFDKPTIVIKDDKTSYSFDTSPIEHVDYPRDLRYAKIEDFKKKLADKIRNTYKKSQEDPNYTTFLKNFGKFEVAKIDKTEVSRDDFILNELRSLNDRFSLVAARVRSGDNLYPFPNWEPDFDNSSGVIDVCCFGDSEEAVAAVVGVLKAHKGVEGWSIEDEDGHNHVKVKMKPRSYSQADALRRQIATIMKSFEIKDVH